MFYLQRRKAPVGGGFLSRPVRRPSVVDGKVVRAELRGDAHVQRPAELLVLAAEGEVRLAELLVPPEQRVEEAELLRARRALPAGLRAEPAHLLVAARRSDSCRRIGTCGKLWSCFSSFFVVL